MPLLTTCDYILGKNGSIVVVVPEQLPRLGAVSLEIHGDVILFRSGGELIGSVPCGEQDILDRLLRNKKVGLVEFADGVPRFPAYITAVADVKMAWRGYAA